tara:strand:+ start:3946 stop:4170 length:225 start_codon:yes stop_codon:yes gene_type:complete
MSDQINQLREISNKMARSTVAVIDAMTQRGAFKGEELTTIGGLRDQCIQVIQINENLEQEDQMEKDLAEDKKSK